MDDAERMLRLLCGTPRQQVLRELVRRVDAVAVLLVLRDSPVLQLAVVRHWTSRRGTPRN